MPPPPAGTPFGAPGMNWVGISQQDWVATGNPGPSPAPLVNTQPQGPGSVPIPTQGTPFGAAGFDWSGVTEQAWTAVGNPGSGFALPLPAPGIPFGTPGFDWGAVQRDSWGKENGDWSGRPEATQLPDSPPPDGWRYERMPFFDGEWALAPIDAPPPPPAAPGFRIFYDVETGEWQQYLSRVAEDGAGTIPNYHQFDGSFESWFKGSSDSAPASIPDGIDPLDSSTWPDELRFAMGLPSREYAMYDPPVAEPGYRNIFDRFEGVWLVVSESDAERLDAAMQRDPDDSTIFASISPAASYRSNDIVRDRLLDLIDDSQTGLDTLIGLPETVLPVPTQASLVFNATANPDLLLLQDPITGKRPPSTFIVNEFDPDLDRLVIPIRVKGRLRSLDIDSFSAVSNLDSLPEAQKSGDAWIYVEETGGLYLDANGARAGSGSKGGLIFDFGESSAITGENIIVVPI